MEEPPLGRKVLGLNGRPGAAQPPGPAPEPPAPTPEPPSRPGPREFARMSRKERRAIPAKERRRLQKQLHEKERRKRRRAERLAAAVCTRCGKNPAADIPRPGGRPGRLCVACLPSEVLENAQP